MEFGPQNHDGHGLLGPNSIVVVYMDPLGYAMKELARISPFFVSAEVETLSSCDVWTPSPKAPHPTMKTSYAP